MRRQLVVALVAAPLLVGSGSVARSSEITPSQPSYRDEPNTIVARFAQPSSPAGSIARLLVESRSKSVKLELFRAGAEPARSVSDSELAGASVAPPRSVRPGWVTVALGRDWSGVYFAQLSSAKGEHGHALLIVRPRRLGASRVAIVMPTYTWAAYNFRDGATWYANAAVHTVDLDRPFLHRGVPYHYRGYDAGFLRWTSQSHVKADWLAQDDLDAVATGDRLASLYTLIVFPGHHEYVTQHEFDIVERYRDLGGHLMFLSANNFFYKVVRRGHYLDGRWRWRDLGRPEARLIGVQYVDWNHNRWPNQPYLATGVRRAPWLFRGTAVRNGMTFGTRYGIEVDATATVSPRGTMVIATIPNVFGKGCTAQMSYYETRTGARVFAAGSMNFGGSATASPVVRRMLLNLWGRLAPRPESDR